MDLGAGLGLGIPRLTQVVLSVRGIHPVLLLSKDTMEGLQLMELRLVGLAGEQAKSEEIVPLIMVGREEMGGVPA